MGQWKSRRRPIRSYQLSLLVVVARLNPAVSKNISRRWRFPTINMEYQSVLIAANSGWGVNAHEQSLPWLGVINFRGSIVALLRRKPSLFNFIRSDRILGRFERARAIT